MSLARSLAVNTGIQLFGKVIATILGIFIIGLLTRFLGQEGFGAYTAATAYLQFFALLLDLGINVTFTALLGEHADDKRYEERCVSAIFTLRFIMVLGAMILAPIIWKLAYPTDTLIFWSIVALNGSVLFPALNQILIGVHQRHLRMYIPTIAEVVGRVIWLGGILLARALGVGIIGLLWLATLSNVVNFCVTLALTWKHHSFKLRWDPAFWKSTLARSWPVGVSIAFNLVYFKADSFLLSRFRSLAEVGIYGAAYRVLEILITVPFIYAGVLLPILSQMRAKKDTTQFSSIIGRSLELMLLFVVPLVIGTWALGPQIMRAIAGDDFMESGIILRVLVIAVGIIYFNTVTSHAIVALQAQRKMLPVYIFAAIFTLTGYLLLIPRYGMWAAAWLTVASECVVCIASSIVTYRFHAFSLHGKKIASIIFSGILMGCFVFPLRNYPLAIPLAVGAIGYVGCLFLFGAVTRDMLKQLRDPTTTQSA
ncbi:flippase [Patescibacteria group bacterium]|nr:flippase [Patescibacteria group bacterium]